jgi:hypothetical protein
MASVDVVFACCVLLGGLWVCRLTFTAAIMKINLLFAAHYGPCKQFRTLKVKTLLLTDCMEPQAWSLWCWKR